jgi:hypothetical protein
MYHFIVEKNTKNLINFTAFAGENYDIDVYEMKEYDENYNQILIDFVTNNNRLEEPLNVDERFKYDEVSDKVIPLSEYEIAVKESNKLIGKLSDMNTKYIKSKYSLERQSSFITLRMNAMSLQRIDIMNELDKIQKWMFNYPMTYYYQKENEILNYVEEIKNGNKTLTDLYSLEFTWDFEQFNEFDPIVTISDVRQMF